jgi:bifunctional oligoribonuclease and PAP phosphatase NrnA
MMEPLIPLLLAHNRFVLTTHVNPDGDALGSELALASWLRERGKDVSIINCSSTPAVYRWLDPDATAIRLYDPQQDDVVLASADVIVLVDANHPDRTRQMERPFRSSPAVKICIDHHLDPAEFADRYFIDTDATSTGEVLYRLLDFEHDRDMSVACAQALYCAIMTDTGSFRFPRTDPGVHRIVAHLLEAGADPVAIYNEVYNHWSTGRIRLLGEALSSLRLTGNDRIASVAVTREMLEHTGTSEEDTDSFTSYPMSIDGVEIGIVFVEVPEGTKMSFRSHGDIPVNLLAREFGGNGHKNASGARVQGARITDLVPKVLAAAEHYLDHKHSSQA